jgi:hypothetical protein
VIAARLASWSPVDWAVAAYTAFVAALAVFCRSAAPEWPLIVAAHAALVLAMVFVPPRGAPWEWPRSEAASRSWARRAARFLRYTYPAVLLTPFFEEVRYTVNATSPAHPYWFEPYLYAADLSMFGTVPAVALSQAGSPAVDELMHAFYFSYYPMIIGGIVLAWMGRGRGRATPGPAFEATLTATMLGFLLAYVWYPFLPARGPWEHAALMSGLREFQGVVFTPLVQWIIGHAAVSGGCFPSAHVSGTWGLIVGLAPAHRRAAIWCCVLGFGLAVACVYTRYHHAVDVFAGVAVGLAGGALGRVLARPEPRERTT